MPDEAARTQLREFTLGWLRGDLETWVRLLDGENDTEARKLLVSRTLAHWMQDPDLAGIRDEANLAKLPEAQGEALRRLWADVQTI